VLHICVLRGCPSFKVAVGNSDRMTEKGRWKKWLWHVSRHCSAVCLERMRNVQNSSVWLNCVVTGIRIAQSWLEVKSVTAWQSLLDASRHIFFIPSHIFPPPPPSVLLSVSSRPKRRLHILSRVLTSYFSLFNSSCPWNVTTRCLHSHDTDRPMSEYLLVEDWSIVPRKWIQDSIKKT
jgi:hypothetical protein